MCGSSGGRIRNHIGAVPGVKYRVPGIARTSFEEETMPSVTSLVGFVDFSASRPLHWVADRLSAELFAGIRFVGRHEGTWDEVEAVHLERDFVGLRVELGGN